MKPNVPWCLTHEQPAVMWAPSGDSPSGRILVCEPDGVDEWGYKRTSDCDVRPARVRTIRRWFQTRTEVTIL